MASSFTPNKTLEEPANGDDLNVWDVPVNNNTTALDLALGGNTVINVTSASGTNNLTLTQYRPPNIVFNGTQTANLTYQLPGNVGGVWSVFNNASGAFTTTIASAGGGRTVLVKQGFRTQVVSDAINVDQTTNTPASPAGNTTEVQFNNGGALGSSPNFIWDGANVTTQVVKLNGSSSGFVGFKAASTVTTPLIWTLPNGDGNNTQVLTTNGSGVLSWSTPSAGGGVTTFNGRGGTVTLLSSDVTGALTYVPTNPAAPGTFAGALYLSAGGNLTLPAGVQAANAIGFLGVPVNARSGNYTTLGNDTGQDNLWTASGNATIASNSSVAYPLGTVLVFTITSGTLGVKCGDTLTFAGVGGTGNRTVASPGFLTARKIQTTNWLVTGLGVS